MAIEKEEEVLEEQRKPGPFSFRACDWPAYKVEVEYYFLVSKVKLSSEQTKCNTLLYLMGAAKAVEITRTFSNRVTEETTLKELIASFEAYFKPQRNAIVERGIFWDRDQKAYESNVDYITVMYNLLELCEYGDYASEMLRDKLCHGMKDRRLAAELRDDNELTLDLVLKRMRSKDRLHLELREEKERQMQKCSASRLRSNEHEEVAAVQCSRRVRRDKQSSVRHVSREGSVKSKSNARQVCCKWCGYGRLHSRTNCPASNKLCYRCDVVGHYARVCTVEVPESVSGKLQGQGSVVPRKENGGEASERSASLGQVHNQSSESPVWKEVLQVGSVHNNVLFCIDSGSDVCVISEQESQKLSPRPNFKSTKTRIRAANNAELEVVSCFNAPLRYRKQTKNTNVYVVRGLRENLLSRHVASKMGILTFHGSSSPGSKTMNFTTPRASPSGVKVSRRVCEVTEDVKCRISKPSSPSVSQPAGKFKSVPVSNKNSNFSEDHIRLVNMINVKKPHGFIKRHCFYRHSVWKKPSSVRPSVISIEPRHYFNKRRIINARISLLRQQSASTVHQSNFVTNQDHKCDT
jgi:hypothetical protein